jgi:hypothetical protein
MGFIAGYVGGNSKDESARLEERVRSFAILPGADPEDYDDFVIETPFGHVIQKYRKDYPVRSAPSRDENGNLVATLGFVHDAGVLKRNEQLLQSCVAHSPRILEQCEGEFVSVFCDGRSGDVHIVNDRFASRPFYFSRQNGRVCFSSNLAFLLYLMGGKHDVDVLGWMQIFSLGHLLGERTHLSDVKRMNPATHVVLSPENKVEENRYWRLQHRPEKNLDAIAHAQAVFAAFRRANATRAGLTGRGVIALSGGLDSRLVAATLPKQVDYHAFTFVNSAGRSSSAETRAAAAVSDALGLRHRIQPIVQRSFSNVAPQVIKLTGGLRPFHHMAVVMFYIDEIKRQGLNFLLGGGPGDVLAGSYVPSVNYFRNNGMDRCIGAFCRDRLSGSQGLALLFRRDLVRQYRREVKKSLLESFQDLRGPTAAHRVTAWAMVYRQPAFTFTSLIHTHPEVAEAFCHLDYAYSDLMLQLPAEWLYNENFYALMIYHCLPELRHVPYANTGELLSSELRRFDHREPFAACAKTIARDLVRTAVLQSSLARSVIGRTRRKRSPSLYLTLLSGDERLCDEIADCLHSYGRLGQVLDANRCMRFLNMCKAGTFPAGIRETELLGSLASMCLAFKYLDL